MERIKRKPKEVALVHHGSYQIHITQKHDMYGWRLKQHGKLVAYDYCHLETKEQAEETAYKYAVGHIRRKYGIERIIKKYGLEE